MCEKNLESRSRPLGACRSTSQNPICGGTKTIERFMIVDPGAFCTVVFLIHHHYARYSDRLLELVLEEFLYRNGNRLSHLLLKAILVEELLVICVRNIGHLYKRRGDVRRSQNDEIGLAKRRILETMNFPDFVKKEFSKSNTLFHGVVLHKI